MMIEKCQKYISSRNSFREIAKNNFFDKNPQISNLIEAINSYVATVMLDLSGKNFRSLENGLYIGDLIVSFTRTHFIVVDLILYSELLEAATLMRKQMELLARLNELKSSKDPSLLLNKTPNLSMLSTQLKRLYSDYSEIAHSANPEKLSLLGKTLHDEKRYTTVYPQFDENSYVALQHLILSVFEYFLWAHVFFKENNFGHDIKSSEKWLNETVEVYEEIYCKT